MVYGYAGAEAEVDAADDGQWHGTARASDVIQRGSVVREERIWQHDIARAIDVDTAAHLLLEGGGI